MNRLAKSRRSPSIPSRSSEPASASAGGSLRVRDGIHGSWTQLASSGVEQSRLEGNRIAVLFDDGHRELRVKDGIEGPWTVLSTDARSFVLQGDYIGMLTREGELWFRIGLEGSWSKVTPTGNVTHYLPVADVQDGSRCEPVSRPGSPVPHYGRFCGAG